MEQTSEINQLKKLAQLLAHNNSMSSDEEQCSKKNMQEMNVDHVVSYYENIINCMPGNVYWLDKNCNAVGCNRNVLTMFGLHSPNQFKGLTFEEMGKRGGWSLDATQSFKRDTLEVLQTGQPKLNVEEPPIPDYSGKLIYFLTSRMPLFDKDNVVTGVVGISIDITLRKEIESALKLEKEKAEVANKAKTEFLQNMRHDLRTPLMGIMGYAELLKEKTKNLQQKQYIDNLIVSSHELLNVLNEVLEAVDMGSGKDPVYKAKFNFKARVEEVIKLYQAKAAQKSIALQLEMDSQIPPEIIGDSFRIHRIMLELMANALNFTEKGYVKLTVNLAKKVQQDLVVKIIIEDTGIGIDVSQQQIIFHPFKRLSPSYKGLYKGMGLGLSLVKQFIDDLGGEIYLSSQVGKGSTFTCVLPLKEPLL